MVGEGGVFVRSSTNAEDLPGFNGAGLYDTVPNVRGAAALSSAVRGVWASVWNLRAYEEREFYGIDHRHVYGAVLVQVGVDATAAGVLVTAHPTDSSVRKVYSINAKSGLGIRVVEGKKVPESILYNWRNRGITVLSRSDEETMLVFDSSGGVREVPNPRRGKPVLTDSRVRALGAAARRIVRLFPKGQPLDIEWLFRGDDLFIVQARPFVGGGPGR
jgi:phosphoenolpyruvate synthase/pyruvate phosphate dikinase